MFRGAGRPPVLAEISPPRGDRVRPGALGRSQLEALGDVLRAVGDSRTVLATGDEGKSALALGLATVAAADGRRAALVECDLAAPTHARRLGLAAAPGLHEYLRGEAEAEQVLQALALAGPASGRAVAPLVCVTGGTPTPDGPALLRSPAFGHAVAKLSSAYDLLVLDGPPAHEETSLTAVAALADTTLASCSRSAAPETRGIRVDGLVIHG